MGRHIPQILTLCNLLCGCIAAVMALMNKLEWAAVFVFLGIFFDFFDGLAARALNAQSELGVQLDSLADMVTSGLVPGLVVYQLFQLSLHGGWGSTGSWDAAGDQSSWFTLVLPFFAFLITLSSAYRLARFNIDEDQQTSFTGLPTPANALLILSLPLILLYQGNDLVSGIILDPWFLIGLVVLSSFLLNAPVKLFALKFKDWSFKQNAWKYCFLIIAAALLLTMRFMAIPLIIVLYVVSSLVYKLGEKTDSA